MWYPFIHFFQLFLCSLKIHISYWKYFCLPLANKDDFTSILMANNSKEKSMKSRSMTYPQHDSIMFVWLHVLTISECIFWWYSSKSSIFSAWILILEAKYFDQIYSTKSSPNFLLFGSFTANKNSETDFKFWFCLTLLVI